MTQTIGLNRSARTLLTALRRAERHETPFSYWLLEDVLPESVCDGVAALPFVAPDAPVFDGRREANNAKRIYFTKETYLRFPVCREVVEAFRDERVKREIERVTGARLAKGRLRVEYCQDVDGFWLEPHVDIPEKLLTLLVYLTDSPELHDAGTDIYDASPAHARVATVPYEWNTGFAFVPGKNTWHGFSKRPIGGVRKSLIVNFVSPQWRAVHELS
jgi:hypothetical protein